MSNAWLARLQQAVAMSLGLRLCFALQDTGSWSQVFSFQAPPLPGADGSVHILTLADQGVGEVRMGSRAWGTAGAAQQ